MENKGGGRSRWRAKIHLSGWKKEGSSVLEARVAVQVIARIRLKFFAVKPG